MSEVAVQTVGELVVPASLEEKVAPRVISRRSERGMVSAEWAVGLIAAIAVAGVLLIVVRNPVVSDALLKFMLHVINLMSATK